MARKSSSARIRQADLDEIVNVVKRHSRLGVIEGIRMALAIIDTAKNNHIPLEDVIEKLYEQIEKIQTRP